MKRFGLCSLLWYHLPGKRFDIFPFTGDDDAQKVDAFIFLNTLHHNIGSVDTQSAIVCDDHTKPVLATCSLHTNSGCGEERDILIGPW